MAPVEMALKTSDRRRGRRSKQTSICTCFDRRFLPALKGFDRRFCKRSKVLTAVSKGKQRF